MIKFVVFEGRFDFPRTYVVLFYLFDGQSVANSDNNKSTVPATRRNMLSEAD
jgi:hypothetical protein